MRPSFSASCEAATRQFEHARESRVTAPRVFTLLSVLTCACSSELLPPGELVLTSGQESDTWSRSPAPVTIEVHKQLENGDREQLRTLKVPAEAFQLDR